VDGVRGQRTTATTAFLTVDRLLADIAFQRQRERQRVVAGGRQSRRRRENGQRSAEISAMGKCLTYLYFTRSVVGIPGVCRLRPRYR